MAEIYKGVWEDDQGNKLYSDNDTETTRDSSGIPLNNGGDLSEASVNFTVGTSRKALTPKARFKALMGDIAKWLTDLGPAAFYKVADDFTTTAENYLFTARKGKQLKDEIDGINSDLAGYKFGTTSDGKPGYIMPGGADTVIPFKSHTIFDASVSVGSSDASSVTVPLTKYYPNYSKITAANIFVKYKNGTLMGYAKTGGSSFSSVLGLSYNNSTGNLTISNAGNNTAGGFYYYRGSTQVFTICIVP